MAELVFLHGAADSAAVWEGQVQHFRPRHRMLALDLPGHGGRLAEVAFETVAQNEDEAVRAIGLRGFRQPVLVGHSMGGAVALAVALAHPRLLQGLVLVASGARLRMRPEPIEEARHRAEVAPPGQPVDRVIPLDAVVWPGASEDVRAWLRARFGRSTAQATYADFLATHHFDVMDRLGEVGVPTLVVGGEDDLWTPPKFQHHLAQHIPQARLVLLAHTGHYPFVEQAAAFNEQLEAFFAKLEP